MVRMRHHSSLLKEAYVTHTFRVEEHLDTRMKFRAKQKYGGNVQAYILSLIIRDVELPDTPNCADCGFRRMAEFCIEQLRNSQSG